MLLHHKTCRPVHSSKSSCSSRSNYSSEPNCSKSVLLSVTKWVVWVDVRKYLTAFSYSTKTAASVAGLHALIHYTDSCIS